MVVCWSYRLKTGLVDWRTSCCKTLTNQSEQDVCVYGQNQRKCDQTYLDSCFRCCAGFMKTKITFFVWQHYSYTVIIFNTMGAPPTVRRLVCILFLYSGFNRKSSPSVDHLWRWRWATRRSRKTYSAGTTSGICSGELNKIHISQKSCRKAIRCTAGSCF